MSRRRFDRLLRLAVFVLDSCVIMQTFLLAYHLRASLGRLNDPATLNQLLLQIMPLATALWVAAIAARGGYDSREYGAGTVPYRRVLNASLMVLAGMAATLFLTRTPLSRAFFILLFVIGVPLLLAERLVVRRLLHLLYRHGHGLYRVLLVGSPEQVAELRVLLGRVTWLGLHPVATVMLPQPSPGQAHTGPLDHTDRLFSVARDNRVDLVLFAAGAVPSSTDFRRYVWQFEGHHTQLAVVPSLADVAADRIRTRPVAGLPIVYVEEPHTGRALSSSKRVFDVLASVIGLVATSPVLLITAVAVYLTDRGPVLFRQTRVGRDGRTFTMLKFRSMVLDAESRLKELQGGNTTNTVMFKLKKDPRVTRVGGLIRRYSIDELPQLINIIKGDMSLIGPRPPLPREVERYSEEEMRRLRVRPGLTGLWQVSGRSNLSWEETVRLDLYYIDNWSPLQDLAILARTIHAVVASRGAY